MATNEKRRSESGVVTRLAERGEEAMTRLMEELGRNRKVTEALSRALTAKGRLDSASRAALTQVGLAPADDVVELRSQVEALERRLRKLESAQAATAPTTGRRRTAQPSGGAKAETSTRARRTPKTQGSQTT